MSLILLLLEDTHINTHMHTYLYVCFCHVHATAIRNRMLCVLVEEHHFLMLLWFSLAQIKSLRHIIFFMISIIFLIDTSPHMYSIHYINSSELFFSL